MEDWRDLKTLHELLFATGLVLKCGGAKLRVIARHRASTSTRDDGLWIRM